MKEKRGQKYLTKEDGPKTPWAFDQCFLNVAFHYSNMQCLDLCQVQGHTLKFHKQTIDQCKWNGFLHLTVYTVAINLFRDPVIDHCVWSSCAGAVGLSVSHSLSCRQVRCVQLLQLPMLSFQSVPRGSGFFPQLSSWNNNDLKKIFLET